MKHKLRRDPGQGRDLADMLRTDGVTGELWSPDPRVRIAQLRAASAQLRDDYDPGRWPKRGLMRPGQGWSALSATPAVIQATSAQAAGLYPHTLSEPIEPIGPYFGIDWLAQAGFYVHPIEWVLRNIVKNPNIAIFGEPGYGKSSAIKSILFRLLVFYGATLSQQARDQSAPPRIRAVIPADRKGEYDPLLAELGFEPLRLGYGFGGRINPLDAGPLGNFTGLDRSRRDERLKEIMARRIALMVSLLAAKGYVASSSDEATLTVVLQHLTGEATLEGRLATPILPDIHAELACPREALWKARRYYDEREFIADTRLMTDALQSLIDGPLAGLFDGPTTVPMDFSAPISSVNIRAMAGRGDIAVAVAMVCLGAWTNSATAILKPGDIIVQSNDELARLLRVNAATVDYIDTDLRFSRDTQKISINAFHKEGDLSAAGDDGSRASKIAEGMLDLCATKVAYAQKGTAARKLAERIGFNEIECSEMTGWAGAGGKATAATGGRALWRVGDRTFKVSHVLSTVERRINNTNTRLARDVVDLRENQTAGA